MTSVRKPVQVLKSVPTMEGAGVRLRRAFGHAEAPTFDPFLLLDDIHSGNPSDYMAGFPWHPHRGIETVTYVLHGDVDHGDSIGNSGAIGDGDVQWMTAGSGIIHQEMPRKVSGDMRGLQLWVNLPASRKMMDPRYRDIMAGTIPVVRNDNGTAVRVIAGRHKDVAGPMEDLVQAPSYYDVEVPAGETFTCDLPEEHTVFAYVLSGQGRFSTVEGSEYGAEHVVLYGRGEQVSIRGGDTGVRFLLIAGQPIGEPVAWGGPIVMNTEEELHTAFREFREGTFIKVGSRP
ncbi:MAG: pirin family protein [bacterium]|nr:pirin family protein [bacterium]MDT8396870.1 pirin family protein [bacterium]